jgi:ribosomal protein S18 acetylase RimI-like enzyme
MMLPVTESVFEAEHFTGRVWRYEHSAGSEPAEIVSAAMAQKVKLVTCRIPADSDSAATQALVAAGFRLIERLVTFRRPIAPIPEITRTVIPAAPQDRDACVEIAVAALRQDRFHTDPKIDDQIADKIKAAWVSNNLAGRADTCLVARDGAGKAVGFNQLLRVGRDAVIDLIAVAPAAQQQGYGRAMVAAGLRAYSAQADTMRVGTQRSNRASLALYQSLGFALVREELTYHMVL